MNQNLIKKAERATLGEFPELFLQANTEEEINMLKYLERKERFYEEKLAGCP